MKVPLQYSKTGLALTEGFEQCRLVAYKPLPTDPWTIGNFISFLCQSEFYK